jgi:hypothetical protein
MLHDNVDYILSYKSYNIASNTTRVYTQRKRSKVFMKFKQLVVIVLPVVLVSLLANEADAQSRRNRLRTMFTGTGKCLDIINDGDNDKLTMANCGNYSGQSWNIEPAQERGYSRLRTTFTGADKCLDIVNDGENNKLTMADCGNYTGQFWKIEPSDERGYSRLRTMFTGADKCLDIINDGKNNKLTMSDCGNYTGQFWSITK